MIGSYIYKNYYLKKKVEKIAENFLGKMWNCGKTLWKISGKNRGKIARKNCGKKFWKVVNKNCGKNREKIVGKISKKSWKHCGTNCEKFLQFVPQCFHDFFEIFLTFSIRNFFQIFHNFFMQFFLQFFKNSSHTQIFPIFFPMLLQGNVNGS